jgi:hypothetical protein
VSERHHPGHVGAQRALSAASLMVLAALACAALLAACGGSSGGAASASASPSPTPVASPQITSGAPPAGAVDAVRRFWTLVGEGKLAEAQATVVAPGSPLLQWSDEQDGIAAARFVGVVPDSVGRGPAESATIEFAVDVWIEQHPSEPVLWGDQGEHQLFEHVVRMSDGTWQMWDSGTGP